MCGRNWWPRSSSAAGRRTAICATPPSAACARTSRRSEIVREAPKRRATPPKPPPRTVGQADPSRPGLLAGRRRDQGGPGRLLRRGLARTWRPSSSAGRWRWCAARAASTASSFFQKHAWKGLNRNIVLVHDPAGSRRRAADQHRRSRRADRPGAGGRARNPSLGLDASPTGSSRT